MYKNVLFDFDGTIFDTVEGITKSVRYALNKNKMDAPLNELRCFAGPPLLDMFAEKFGVSRDMALKLVIDFRERYNPIGLYECKIFPGIKDLLESLRANNIKIALTTLKPQNLAETLLQREGIIGLFDVIYGTVGENHNMTKADIVKKAMDFLDASVQETILVGDTKYDIIGAHQAGIKAIGVRYGYAAECELEEAGADLILDTPAQVSDYILTHR